MTPPPATFVCPWCEEPVDPRDTANTTRRFDGDFIHNDCLLDWVKARELVKSLIYASAVLDGHAAAIGAPVTQQAIERHSNMLRSCAESVDMAVTSTLEHLR